MRGDVSAALSGEEQVAFLHAQPYPWRKAALELTAEDIDRAWWQALERILADPRYQDLRSETAGLGIDAQGPSGGEERVPERADTTERREYLGKRLTMKAHADLLPLGRDPLSGLEEFAVVGTGAIRLIHPDPTTPEERRPPIVAGEAIVLVLLPGGSATDANNAPTSVKSFLLAKTEVTTSQAPETLGDSGVESLTSPESNLPAMVSWDTARAVFERLRVRPASIEEWHAAAGRDTWRLDFVNEPPSSVARQDPNEHGLYDVLGNAPEWYGTWSAPNLQSSVNGRSGAIRPARDVEPVESPPPPEVISLVLITVLTTDEDKEPEGQFVVILTQGQRRIVEGDWGRAEQWKEGVRKQFVEHPDVVVTGEKIDALVAVRGRGIEWSCRVQIEVRTSTGRSLSFSDDVRFERGQSERFMGSKSF